MSVGHPMPDAPPQRVPGSRAVVLMAAAGVLTGLISSLPSSLPIIRLQDAGLILNAKHFPLHAGLIFGITLGAVLWLKVHRDAGRCLLAAGLTLVGWFAGTNTANDAYQLAVGSELFGIAPGAKANREIVGLVIGGIFGGAVGAGLTAFGCAIPAEPIRQPRNWIFVVAVGAVAGLLLVPAAGFDMPMLLFVPWQASVAAAIGFCLVRT